MEKLATWELFRAEIERNIFPKKTDIQYILAPLKQITSNDYFNTLVNLRYMAAYEQALNEYLHPKAEFKVANIRAEIFHLGSFIEGLLYIFLENKKVLKGSTTLNNLLNICKKHKFIDDPMYQRLNSLRKLRNKIHPNVIIDSFGNEFWIDEYEVVAFRNILTDLITELFS